MQEKGGEWWNILSFYQMTNIARKLLTLCDNGMPFSKLHRFYIKHSIPQQQAGASKTVLTVMPPPSDPSIYCRIYLSAEGSDERQNEGKLLAPATQCCKKCL